MTRVQHEKAVELLREIRNTKETIYRLKTETLNIAHISMVNYSIDKELAILILGYLQEKLRSLEEEFSKL